MIFSGNQVTQLYCALGLANAVPTSLGYIYPHANTGKTHFYVQQLGNGGLVRSDLIEIDKIKYAKVTPSSAMAHPLDRYEIALDSTVSATPISGQDYITRIMFKHYIGLGEEDQYFKFGAVHATAGMSASDFYVAMAKSIAKNLSREVDSLLTVYLKTTGSTFTTVTSATTTASLTGTYSAVVLEQTAQNWILGRMPVTYIPFVVQPTTIKVSGVDSIWGTVTQVTPVNSVDNGKLMADLEYYCMGNRADVYRNMGFPMSIVTNYFVDPTKKYDTLVIHFYHEGDNASPQKSEKDLEILAIDDGSHTSMKAIIAAINTATGLSITSL